jgi:hypothetical protein
MVDMMILSLSGLVSHKKVSPVPPTREKHRDTPSVFLVLLAELLNHLVLFFPREKHVCEDDYRESDKREYGGPVDYAFAEDRQKDSGVLRVSDEGIRTTRCKSALLTGAVNF